MTEIKNSCWSGKLVIIWTINLSHSRITELVVHWKIYIKTWHIFLSCFYRKQTHHMKTTDHKNREPRLVETRGWWGINLYLGYNQLENCAQSYHISCSPLPHTVFKTPSLKVTGDFWSRTRAACSPCLVPAIKAALYFTTTYASRLALLYKGEWM